MTPPDKGPPRLRPLRSDKGAASPALRPGRHLLMSLNVGTKYRGGRLVKIIEFDHSVVVKFGPPGLASFV